MFWTLVLPILLSIAVYALGKYIENVVDGYKVARFEKYQSETARLAADERDKRLAFLIGEELERRAGDRRVIEARVETSGDSTMPAPTGNA